MKQLLKLRKIVIFQPLVSKASFVGMCYMFGMLVGSFVFGVLSDKLGRKLSLLTAIVIASVTSFGGAFLTEYYSYLAIRLLTGIAAKGLFMLAFMISVEISGADYKMYLGILIQVRLGRDNY